MKIASIGPMTRDFLIPKGRTIPKESDIHIGCICDTSGQFVIPGFEQKVCPTSGAINNQIFFALSMEIIEQFFGKTVPDLIRQLERLNDALEQLVAAQEQQPRDKDDANA